MSRSFRSPYRSGLCRAAGIPSGHDPTKTLREAVCYHCGADCKPIDAPFVYRCDACKKNPVSFVRFGQVVFTAEETDQHCTQDMYKMLDLRRAKS